MVNAQSYPNLRPNSHSTICSQICGYTTRNHVYGQNKGDQPWVIFASGLRINNQQSRGIQPRMIRIYSIYIYIHLLNDPRGRQPLPSWRAAIVLEQATSHMPDDLAPMIKDYTPCEAATWYCLCNLMDDYRLVATMFVILANNNSNDSTRFADWPR